MPDFNEPQSRNEAILQNMLGADNVLPEPQSRIEELLQEILEQGQGGSVTPESIVTATGQMTTQQAADTLGNIGGVAQDGGVATVPTIVASLSDDDGVRVEGGIDQNNDAYLTLVDTYGDENVLVGGLAAPVNANDAANKAYVDGYTVTVSGTTPSIAAADNTIYECGELTSLTISSFPATGKFWIWFTSGATPTTTTGIANFTAEANKLYKITVENGYATYDSWPVS